MSPEGPQHSPRNTPQQLHTEPKWGEERNHPDIQAVEARIEQRTQEEISAAAIGEKTGEAYESEPAYIKNKVGEEEWRKFVEEDPARAEFYRKKIPEVGIFADSRDERLNEEKEKSLVSEPLQRSKQIEDEKTKVYSNYEEDPEIKKVQEKISTVGYEQDQLHVNEDGGSESSVRRSRIIRRAEREAWGELVKQFPEKAEAYRGKVSSLDELLTAKAAEEKAQTKVVEETLRRVQSFKDEFGKNNGPANQERITAYTEKIWGEFIQQHPDVADAYKDKVEGIGQALAQAQLEKDAERRGEVLMRLKDLDNPHPEIVASTSKPRERSGAESSPAEDETLPTAPEETSHEKREDPHEHKDEEHKEQHDKKEDGHEGGGSGHEGGGDGHHDHGPLPIEAKLAGLSVGAAVLAAIVKPKTFFMWGFYDYLAIEMVKHLKDNWKSLLQDFWPFGKISFGAGGGGKKAESHGGGHDDHGHGGGGHDDHGGGGHGGH